MASPGYLMICCLGNKTSIPNNVVPVGYIELQVETVNVISLIFAILGSLGIGIVAIPWKRQSRRSSWRRTQMMSGPNFGSIVSFLIAAGILGNLGIVVRSSVWLAEGFYPIFEDGNYADFRHVFCIFTAMWVEYFYLCSVFWHLVYGLEAYMVSQKRTSPVYIHHILGWLFPVGFCGIGAWVVYQPSLSHCSARVAIDKGMLYLVALAPVVVVIFLLSLLLYRANKAVKRSLIHHFGRFSTSEREILDAIQIKFFLFITAFSVSWLPNLIDGVWMNIGTFNEKSKALFLVLLVLMSVLNPVLVLLDAMILWGWPPRIWCCLSGAGHSEYLDVADSQGEGHLQGSSRRSRSRSYSSTETDPLISFRRSQT